MLKLLKIFPILFSVVPLLSCGEINFESTRNQTNSFQNSGGRSLYFDIGDRTFVGFVSYAEDPKGNTMVSPIVVGEGLVHVEMLEDLSAGLVGNGRKPRFRVPLATISFFDAPGEPPITLGTLKDFELLTNPSRFNEFSTFVQNLIEEHIHQAGR